MAFCPDGRYRQLFSPSRVQSDRDGAEVVVAPEKEPFVILQAVHHVINVQETFFLFLKRIAVIRFIFEADGQHVRAGIILPLHHFRDHIQVIILHQAAFVDIIIERIRIFHVADGVHAFDRVGVDGAHFFAGDKKHAVVNIGIAVPVREIGIVPGRVHIAVISICIHGVPGMGVGIAQGPVSAFHTGHDVGKCAGVAAADRGMVYERAVAVVAVVQRLGLVIADQAAELVMNGLYPAPEIRAGRSLPDDRSAWASISCFICSICCLLRS